MSCIKCDGKVGFESDICYDCGYDNATFNYKDYLFCGFMGLVIFLGMLSVIQAQTPQTLYIAIDSTNNSQMLKRELERTNWQARINPIVLQSLNPAQRSSFNEFCLRMEKSQKRISKLWTVEYVNYHDENAPTGIYPQYRIGKYREWNQFNRRSFSEVSYPLRTIEYLYEQWYYQDFVDRALEKNIHEVDQFLKKKRAIYYKWVQKTQDDPNTVGGLFYQHTKYYVLYKKELEEKKLTGKYLPKKSHFEPLKLPYE